MALSAMRWTGGKSATAATGTGPWIASLLPWNATGVYAEPFGGMAGVLINRKPMRHEILNDLDGDVCNWWEVVRDRPSEFQRALELTPKSEAFHHVARAHMPAAPGTTDVARAVEFTHLVMNAVVLDGPFVLYKGGANSLSGDWRRGLPDRIHALAARLRNVQLACRDAVTLLRELSGYEDAVVYCDPQYPGTAGDSALYRHTVDVYAMEQVLQEQKGQVAVSGYGHTWDGLGWERHEHGTFTSAHASQQANERVEVLWTNYAPGKQKSLWGDAS